MKYTYKDLMEHIEEEERDFTIIKIDGKSYRFLVIVVLEVLLAEGIFQQG